MLSREAPTAKKKHRARAGWYRGTNDTCRRHIASYHYKEYTKRCGECKIPKNHRAMAKHVLAEREKTALAAATGKKPKVQSTLDSVVVKLVTPTAFSKVAILEAVTTHIICNTQVCNSHIPLAWQLH